MSLKVSNLNFAYNKRSLSLKDVNFELKDNDIVGLIGAQSAGKTTLLRVLCGLEKQYFGQIVFDNVDFKNIALANACISYLPTDPVFMENKSILENLKFQCKICDIDFDKLDIKQIYEYFSFEVPLKTKVKKLSLCDKRILALIRSYIKKPKFLFVDDLFEGVDDNSVFKIKNAICKYLNSKNHIKNVILTLNNKILENICNVFFYVGYGTVSKYNNLEELKIDCPDLFVAQFFNAHTKYFNLEYDGNVFYLSNAKQCEGGLKILLDEKLYDKLEKCKLESGQSLDVVCTSFEDYKFDAIDEVLLNKCFKTGDINMFEKNTLVKII